MDHKSESSLAWAEQTFSVEGQTAVSDLDFMGCTVSVAIFQLCHCSIKAALDNDLTMSESMNECCCVPIKL